MLQAERKQVNGAALTSELKRWYSEAAQTCCSADGDNQEKPRQIGSFSPSRGHAVSSTIAPEPSVNLYPSHRLLRRTSGGQSGARCKLAKTAIRTAHTREATGCPSVILQVPTSFTNQRVACQRTQLGCEVG